MCSLLDGVRDGVVDCQRRGRALHLRLPRHSSASGLHSATGRDHRSHRCRVHDDRRSTVGATLSPHGVPRRRLKRHRLWGPAYRVRPFAAVRWRLHVDSQPAPLNRPSHCPSRLQRPYHLLPANCGNLSGRQVGRQRRRWSASATSGGEEPQRHADARRRGCRLRRLYTAGRHHVSRVRRRVRGRARPGGEGRSRVQRCSASSLFSRQLCRVLSLQRPVPLRPFRHALSTTTTGGDSWWPLAGESQARPGFSSGVERLMSPLPSMDVWRHCLGISV